MPKKIIIAEDNEDARETYTDCIKLFLKVDIDGVPNGEELVERVKVGGYDLVITDNDMGGGINGLEAIERIRQFYKTIPIFMFSSDSAKYRDLKSLALKSGATGYVDKGAAAFDIRVFIDEIKPYLL